LTKKKKRFVKLHKNHEIWILEKGFDLSGGPFSASIKNRNALMPRGKFLLSSHKGKQKEPRGVPRDPRTALRQQ
jgi:hypothetical protein